MYIALTLPKSPTGLNSLHEISSNSKAHYFSIPLHLRYSTVQSKATTNPSQPEAPGPVRQGSTSQPSTLPSGQQGSPSAADQPPPAQHTQYPEQAVSASPGLAASADLAALPGQPVSPTRAAPLSALPGQATSNGRGQGASPGQAPAAHTEPYALPSAGPCPPSSTSAPASAGDRKSPLRRSPDPHSTGTVRAVHPHAAQHNAPSSHNLSGGECA